MTTNTALYEAGRYFVVKATQHKGFDVYEHSTSFSHSRRCAQIGYEGTAGFERAKAEADRRAGERQ